MNRGRHSIIVFKRQRLMPTKRRWREEASVQVVPGTAYAYCVAHDLAKLAPSALIRLKMRLENQRPLTQRDDGVGSKWLTLDGIGGPDVLCMFWISVLRRSFVVAWRSSWSPFRISMRKAESIAENRPAYRNTTTSDIIKSAESTELTNMSNGSRSLFSMLMIWSSVTLACTIYFFQISALSAQNWVKGPSLSGAAVFWALGSVCNDTAAFWALDSVYNEDDISFCPT